MVFKKFRCCSFFVSQTLLDYKNYLVKIQLRVKLYVIIKLSIHFYKKYEKDETMRLDKFLKVSRIIKRRTVAKDATNGGVVLVNGKESKASTKVKVGDVLDITFGERTMTVRILDLKDTTKKEEASQLYEVISE
jgi:Ribosome-associated heat shock protein implicated in the recycling of the 50S subunit (S4 paralog)